MKNWLIIVPARLASTRLAEKPLALLGSKPLVVRVVENLKPLQDKGARVVVATDSEKVLEVCRQHHIDAQNTSTDHQSGTDRCWEVAEKCASPFVMNIQGDEPFVNSLDLEKLAQSMEQRPEALIGTMAFASQSASEFFDSNTVKVVCSEKMNARYFSRAPIPYHRDGQNHFSGEFWKHIGVYAFTRKSLQQFCLMPPSQLECTERLEQLRAIENDWEIYVQASSVDCHGIDTPQDLQAACAAKDWD